MPPSSGRCNPAAALARCNSTSSLKEPPDLETPAYCRDASTNIKLSSRLGKRMLVCFYPGDVICACATKVSAVADEYPALQEVGVEVISVSVDSHFVHKMWND